MSLANVKVKMNRKHKHNFLKTKNLFFDDILFAKKQTKNICILKLIN